MTPRFFGGSVLALVAFTMLCGYFLTDVMSPLNRCLKGAAVG